MFLRHFSKFSIPLGSTILKAPKTLVNIAFRGFFIPIKFSQNLLNLSTIYSFLSTKLSTGNQKRG